MIKQARILLVEDSPTQAQQMRELLESCGWTVIVRPGAEQALNEIAEIFPDLIMVDYHLPHMAGDEFCRQVRMRIDTRIIPVIMLTSETSADLETRGLESGADDFVRKSTNPDHLILRIRTLLRRMDNSSSLLRTVAFESSKSRVLAIDDSGTYLAYLREQLVGELYQLDTATSGAEALKIVETGDFDCVLVDLVMPGMDGIEVCRQIDGWRRRCAGQTMILMLTANEDTAGLEQALEAGADDFVGKSSDIVVVKVRIRALLRRKFYEDENRRILDELRKREMEAERARMAQESAEARAALFDQLQQTASDLLRTNAELEEFAYAASHDLRAPLHAIGNLAEWLQDDLNDRLSGDEKHRFELIRSRATRLQSLIEDLLQYSKAGRSDVPAEPVETAALVREIVDLQSPPPGFVIKVSSALPVVVTAKPPLQQVFTNLIANAIKHHHRPDGRIEVFAEDQGQFYLFTVRDDGPGIPPEFQNRAFQLFQTLSSRDRKEGSGLGLAVARRITDKQGATIRISSDGQHGSDFLFTWPKTPSRSSGAIPSLSPIARLPEVDILSAS